jgi:hypothetical protein
MTEDITSTGREWLLADLEARLSPMLGALAAPLGPCEVHVGRLAPLAPNRLPALCLYLPEADLGAEHVREVKYSVAMEVRTRSGTGWDVHAMRITERILDTLMRDSSWITLWGVPPSIRTRQFANGEGEHAMVGETILMDLSPAARLTYPARGAALAVMTVTTETDAGAVVTSTVGDQPTP